MTTPHQPAVERVHPPKAPYLVINRIVGWLLRSPRRASKIGGSLLLLHLTGRKTGRELTVPVAYRPSADGRLVALTNSVWRVNLRDRPDVEVTLLGRRQPAIAQLVEEPDIVADTYQSLIEQEGHQKAGRRMGIRINVDRVPTHEELRQAAVREKLSVVYLEVPGTRR